MLNKKDLTLLEKVFAAEIEGRLPFQSKLNGYKKLEDAGLVQHGSEIIPSPLGGIKVSGWYLTQAGRMAYCESCRDLPEREE